MMTTIPTRTRLAAAALAAALVSMTTLAARAQDWAKARLEKSPRHLEWVKVKQGSREVNCFVAFPEVKDKATAVVVIHEIFGPHATGCAASPTSSPRRATSRSRRTCSPAWRPAAAARRSSAARTPCAKAISQLPPEQITADLNAVAAYVAKLPACNGKIAVAGFCWGGGADVPLRDEHEGRRRRRSCSTAPGPEKAEDIARIACPVYGFYGENDARVNATIPKSTEADEEGGQDLRARSPTTAPATASCAPAKSPARTSPTKKPAPKPGPAGSPYSPSSKIGSDPISGRALRNVGQEFAGNWVRPNFTGW